MTEFQGSVFGLQFDGGMIGSERDSRTVHWPISTHSLGSSALHSLCFVEDFTSDHCDWKRTVQSYSSQPVHRWRASYDVTDGVG